MTGIKRAIIGSESSPADIVKTYFRTAAVFKKYDIEYCCGGKWPLRMVCETQGLNLDQLLQELEVAAQVIRLPASLPYSDWKINFLTDYIINIHHYYLHQALPVIRNQLQHFVKEHKNKFPFLAEVLSDYHLFEKKIIPHLKQEEEVIFPYVRQIAHAYESKESYAPLLVRTLRKPIQELIDHEHEFTEKIINRFRELTNNYNPPEAGCTSHRLAYSLLRELDEDMVQHLHLENNILFPKAILMEKELLDRN